MRHRPNSSFRSMKRRAATIVFVAVSSTVLLSMGAVALDLGTLYSARAELQRSADAAALAAASFLSNYTGDDAALLDEADRIARLNSVLGISAGLESGDLELGRSVYDEATGQFSFESASENPNAVRVVVRRSEGSEGGPINFAFARLFGRNQRDVTARAAAVLIPRDISVVIDLSGSMTDDSELRYWDRDDGGYSNLRDVWASVWSPDADGPVEPQRPYEPTSELDSEYAGVNGLGFGNMDEWGDPLLPGAYDAASDPGLMHIRKKQTCTDPKVMASLAARGYTPEEQQALLSGALDNSSQHFKNRLAVLLGLADWHSGQYGASHIGDGNGDTYVSNSEIDYVVDYPPYRVNWSWNDYISYVSGTGLPNEFRERYGLKTYTDFLVNNKPESWRNSTMWAAPQQPLRAVKDAVQTMMSVITENDSLDNVGLGIFATDEHMEHGLTASVQDIPNRLYEMQAGHYNTYTNIGGGIDQAIEQLGGEAARRNASKVIVLMSDGVPNIDQYGNYDPAAARAWAVERARAAAAAGYTIYTVSVGYNADRALMQEIAHIGRGQEFYAAGSPEEYTNQLSEIFRSLGGKRPVALIE